MPLPPCPKGRIPLIESATGQDFDSGACQLRENGKTAFFNVIPEKSGIQKEKRGREFRLSPE